MKPLQKAALANTLAIVMGVFFIICSLLATIAPEFYLSVAGTAFHWVKPSAIGVVQTFGSFIVGFFYTVVLSWLIGYCIAWTYTRLASIKAQPIALAREPNALR